MLNTHLVSAQYPPLFQNFGSQLSQKRVKLETGFDDDTTIKFAYSQKSLLEHAMHMHMHISVRCSISAQEEQPWMFSVAAFTTLQTTASIFQYNCAQLKKKTSDIISSKLKQCCSNTTL